MPPPERLTALESEMSQVERDLLAATLRDDQTEAARLRRRAADLFGQWADVRWAEARKRPLPELPLQ